MVFRLNKLISILFLFKIVNVGLNIPENFLKSNVLNPNFEQIRTHPRLNLAFLIFVHYFIGYILNRFWGQRNRVVKQLWHAPLLILLLLLFIVFLLPEILIYIE